VAAGAASFDRPEMRKMALKKTRPVNCTTTAETDRFWVSVWPTIAEFDMAMFLQKRRTTMARLHMDERKNDTRADGGIAE
jgi:hypothetical protein